MFWNANTPTISIVSLRGYKKQTRVPYVETKFIVVTSYWPHYPKHEVFSREQCDAIYEPSLTKFIWNRFH